MRRRFIRFASAPALVLAIALGAFGCGKKATQEATPQPAPSTSNQTPGEPIARVQSTTPSAVQPNAESDLAELNRDLIRWIVRNKRRPANFEEFAASAGAPIPPAPPGKKYVLVNPPRIQLSNQ